MTRTELNSHRHPTEASRFWLTMLVIVPTIIAGAALVIFLSGIPLLVVAFGVFGVWVTTKLLIARFTRNLVQVSEVNFPEVDTAIQECKAKFAYRKPVQAYVYEGNGYNALLIPLLQRKVMLLDADVLSSARSSNEIKWLVGRFVGALASKHYRFMWMQVVLDSVERLWVFNLLLYPYERAVMKSGDQLGLLAVEGDIESANLALVKTMTGADIAERVQLAGLRDQSGQIDGSFFAWLAKCLSPTPHTIGRIENLVRHARLHYPDQAAAFLAAHGMPETPRVTASTAGRPMSLAPAGTVQGAPPNSDTALPGKA